MKKKSSWLIIILLLLVGITSIYVAGTYAKYTASLGTQNGEATIAKWNFDVENSSVTMDVNFTPTYNPATLTAQRIAPGTVGKFVIELANTTSEVGVDYTLDFGNVTPAIGTFSFNVTNNGITLNPNTGLYEGHLNIGETVNVNVEWEWLYEAEEIDEDTMTAEEIAAAQAANEAQDTQDTTVGKAGGADGTKLLVPVTITGVQSEPEPVIQP